MENRQVLMLGLVVAMAILSMLLSTWHFTRRRRMQGAARRDMRSVARQLGLSFGAAGGLPHGEMFTFLPLFSRGNEPTLANVMRGDDEVMFHLCYDADGMIETRRDVVETGIALKDSSCLVPFFAVEPGRSKREDLDAGAGITDELRTRYRVDGDAADIRVALGAGLGRYLVTNPGWSVSGSAEWIVVSRTERVPIEELISFRDQAHQIADLARAGITPQVRTGK